MLDQGDGIYVYAACKYAIINGICNDSIDNLNSYFEDEIVEKAEEYYEFLNKEL